MLSSLTLQSEQLDRDGYTLVDDVFSDDEVNAILNKIEVAEGSAETFRRSADLFAIRQFLKEVPDVAPLIFGQKLKNVIYGLFGSDYFVVKSIYFDKPPASNWYVGWHQDLTISVDKRIDMDGFGPWTVKQNQFAVQPPISLLENIFTIRIHLDDTNEHNGALKVIPGSHAGQIIRPETLNTEGETVINCSVSRGGIMIMKPLLLHSSNRTTNQKQRRVIHIEFSSAQLPAGIQWAELMEFE